MPKKGYKQTAEHAEKSDAHKLHLSETRKRLFKEGKLKSPTEGMHHSDETKQLIGQASKLRWQHREHPMKGKHISEEHKRKDSESHILLYKNGFIHPMTGTHRSEETKQKISAKNTGRVFSEETHALWSKQRSGENNGRWCGGKSFEPYTTDFTAKFKESIRERDDYGCIICNAFQDDLPQKLHVHHIDYDKTNCLPQNCVSLCKRCHMISNGNRSHWKSFLQNVLTERYNYEYTEDNKIVLDLTGGK